VIDQEEHEMIHGIFGLKQAVVREVMVPRTDIKCVSSKAKIEDIIGLILSEGHSRIPVFEDKIDNIVGVVYAKDLLEFWGKCGEEIPLERVMRQPYFIPETKRLEELVLHTGNKEAGGVAQGIQGKAGSYGHCRR